MALKALAQVDVERADSASILRPLRYLRLADKGGDALKVIGACRL